MVLIQEGSTRPKPLHHNHKATFWKDNTFNPKFLNLGCLRVGFSHFCVRAEKKTALKRPRLCSPKALLDLKNKFQQNLELLQKMWEGPKFILKRGVQNSGFWMSNRAGEHAVAPNCSETHCFKAFRGDGPLQMDPHQTRIRRCKKPAEWGASKRKWGPALNKCPFETPQKMTQQLWNLENLKPQFRTRKQGVSETTSSKMNLPGPLVNS